MHQVGFSLHDKLDNYGQRKQNKTVIHVHKYSYEVSVRHLSAIVTKNEICKLILIEVRYEIRRKSCR